MLNLEKDRHSQYQRKLQWIVQRINELPPLIDNDKYYEFLLDSLFYRLQTSIDAVMDVIAMICKDFGESVGDDYSNIDFLTRIFRNSIQLFNYLEFL